MGTRSRIGIENEDGTVRSIYCHWDGYLDGNGSILLNDYKNAQKINELIDLGNISSLGEQVHPPKGVPHSYDNSVDDVTVAYGRDRGEDNIEASVDEDWNGVQGEEYGYVFSKGKWFVSDHGRKFVELTQELIHAE